MSFMKPYENVAILSVFTGAASGLGLAANIDWQSPAIGLTCVAGVSAALIGLATSACMPK